MAGCIILVSMPGAERAKPTVRRGRRVQTPVADSAPASLRVQRPRRTAPFLPDDPFPVSVATFDWLLSRENLAARYVALRDLLGRGPKDPDLKKAARELPRDAFLRDFLPLLARKLAPGGTADDLVHRYDGGLWQTLFLTEIGGGRTLPEVRRAGPVLLAHWERSFVEIDRGEPATAEPILFGVACRTLARIGFAEDPRIVAAVDRFARRRLEAERHPLPASKDLLLFTALPERVRTGPIREAISFAVERTVREELTGIPSAGALLGFPVFDRSDPLEVLEALAAAGVARRPGIVAALATLVSRADHRARWKLERSAGAPMLLEPEATGELSRWVTLRALKVMQHFLGLTTTPGARGG